MNVKTIYATIHWLAPDVEEVTHAFGVVPNEWLDQDMSDHPDDTYIFYWLYPHELKDFKRGFTNGQWEVFSVSDE